jgi:hypothetical protein
MDCPKLVDLFEEQRMGEALLIKLIGAIAAAFGGVIVYGVKHILGKISEIKTETEIRQMINDNAEAQDVQLRMVYDSIKRIEELLFNLMEKSHVNRNPKGNRH